MAKPKQQIYEGVRVLDLGNRYDGTTIASSYMADFGADVIKIDQPGEDPPARGGIYVKDGIDLSYKVQGRNKRHVTLDISKPRGSEIFHKLVAKADVVIETYEPGVMEKWGHSWEVLSSVNPGLVFCRISPFGQTGPYAHRKIDGRTAEAFGGLAYSVGEPDGPPLHSQMDIGGEVAGMWALMGINIALYHRDTKGKRKGQVVDVALWEPIYRQNRTLVTSYTVEGKLSKRIGSIGGSPFMDCHETKDGKYYTYSGGTRATYRDTILAMGMNIDPRFKDIPTTRMHGKEFHDEARKWMKQRTLAEAEDAFFALEGAGAPCNNAEELFKDPQIKARDLIVSVDDPDLGKIKMQGIVPKFSKTPGKVKHSGERPGARNKEVYSELLGFSAKELAALKKDGII